MPLEDEMAVDRYEVRAELLGIDPASDIDVTTCDGWLTITADRRQEVDFNGRSEFAYGSFARSVPLPVGAALESIATSYHNGILTVSVPVSDTEAAADDDEAVEAVD
jgi:HSP20 family molecular chaperone IbpA